MKTYLISVAAVSVLLSLSGLILPKGKTEKLVRTAFAALFLFVLIRPVVGSELSLPAFLPETETVAISDFGEYVREEISSRYEKTFSEVLRQNDLVAESIVVETKGKEIVKVEITLSNLVIDENFPHINNTVIGNYIAGLIGLPSGKVVVYG